MLKRLCDIRLVMYILRAMYTILSPLCPLCTMPYHSIKSVLYYPAHFCVHFLITLNVIISGRFIGVPLQGNIDG